ncbi:MAG: TIGR02302 family protein [Nitratireductor sp.]|nr:TIGR02302 family protein [Nitratireductor sp.]
MTKSDETGQPADSAWHIPTWLRMKAAAALIWERIVPLAMPFLCVVLIFLSASWFGLWRVLPTWVHYPALGLFVIAAIASLLHLRAFRLPETGEITRRVEHASGLEDRPVTAQLDAMAMGSDDDFARTLWAEHRERMAARLRDLSAGMPSPDTDRLDPWALRAFLAIIAFVAFGFSHSSQGGRIADILEPANDTATLLTRTDAWINPPPYTRKPPVYLKTPSQENEADRQAAAATVSDQARVPVEVPEGSELFLRVVGARNIRLAFETTDGPQEIFPDGADPNGTDQARTESARAASRGDETSFRTLLNRDGLVKLLSGNKEIASWPVAVIADTAPRISFSEMPSPALSGSLQLSYSVEDDYGVTAARAEISPLMKQDPDARPLVAAPEVALPLPRQRARSGTSKTVRDLTSHPWAGSKVTITLAAEDDARQTGRSEPHEMVLPGRNFINPLALALLEQRRILALDANKAPYVANLLDAVTTAPEVFIDNAAAFIAMKVAYRRTLDARNDDELREVLDLLWETALAVEFGDLSEAERRLRDAQDALSKALEENASDEEIAKLMDELRKAMDEFMQMLAQQSLQNPQMQNPLTQNDMARMLRQRDLERMMDRIEDLARSGSKDAARQLLSEMQRMMENLRAGRHQQQRQMEGNRTNQALDKLSELMRQQQQLMDETFRMQQRDPQGRENNGEQQEGQNQQGQNQQSQDQQGQQPGGDRPMTAEEFAEAMKRLQEQQEALEKQLGELGEQLKSLGLDPSEAFGEAQQEMGEAGENLGQSRPGDAAGNQGQALEALRRGAQQMMQQMAGDRQPGGQQQGEGQQAGQDRQRSDPLGRREGSDGLESSETTKVPGEIEAQRAREIMEAIRKRLSQPLAPRIEKDYLERLLETE